MSEWKFRVLYKGEEHIVKFRANEKLDAYAKIKNIVFEQYPGAEYERIYDDEE